MQQKVPKIIFENDAFVAVHKPPGWPSIPDRDGATLSVKQWMRDKYGEIFTVHRLDKDTSGIILFAKDAETHRYLSMAFEERAVEKYYLGLVAGTLPEKEKVIDVPIMEHPAGRGQMMVHKRGKDAITAYKVIEEYGRYSLLEFRIFTGRTHQIRVHMQYIEHPIVCDALYGDAAPVYISALKANYNLSRAEEFERPILNRLALHAHRLAFVGPDGKAFALEAPLQKDMAALLQQLEKKKK